MSHYIAGIFPMPWRIFWAVGFPLLTFPTALNSFLLQKAQWAYLCRGQLPKQKMRLEGFEPPTHGLGNRCSIP